MIKSKEMAKSNSCLNKAKDDEMIFVLLERDIASPNTIRYWCRERVFLGKNKVTDAQICNALRCARSMEKK